MTLIELVALRPQETGQGFKKRLAAARRKNRRHIRHIQRTTRVVLARQYYITTALSDVRRVMLLNEDILFACLLVVAILNFSMVNIAANVIYLFIMAASAMSAVSSISIEVLGLGALITIGVLTVWILAWQHNMISIALMQGANHKVKRSFRNTVRLSLRGSARTATAWLLVVLSAFGAPVALLAVIALLIFSKSILFSAALPYVYATGVVGLLWAVSMLANYSLVPFVALFENPADWRSAFRRSRLLVRRKGKIFIVSTFIASGVALGGVYGLAVAGQYLTHISYGLLFGLLGSLVLLVQNALFTMLYRKRKFARQL